MCSILSVTHIYTIFKHCISSTTNTPTIRSGSGETGVKFDCVPVDYGD